MTTAQEQSSDEIDKVNDLTIAVEEVSEAVLTSEIDADKAASALIKSKEAREEAQTKYDDVEKLVKESEEKVSLEEKNLNLASSETQKPKMLKTQLKNHLMRLKH